MLQRPKPPTRTRPEIILSLKEKMQAMSKVEVFNTLVEFFTTVDLDLIASQLPDLPAAPRPQAGDRTPSEVGTVAGRSVAPADGTWDGDPVNNPDPSGFSTG